MVKPSDDSARARFAEELDRNFSVVASAGSGKTTAITERVLSIARSAQAPEILPRLVVVTFANRAADEMQQRARQRILEEDLPLETQTAFNRAFFGTIHSFCMKLLTDYGHYLGLPTPLELLSDDDDLWQEFLQQQTRLGHSLGDGNRAALFRLVQARDVMELARRAGAAALRPTKLAQCPTVDFAELYAASDQGGRDNISKSQAELREWEKRYVADWEYLRWPVCFTSVNANFTELWRETFSPLRKWVCQAAACVAAEVQRDYREFRLERGLVTYGDQIALAEELLQHPLAAPRIRAENLRVILDEAQDTEPAQFAVLLESTRPTSATGHWMETRVDPPRPGHFCMVGDFQQSIYGERADLKYYQSVHDALVQDAGGEALTFSVTFRLDEKQLRFVNETFRDILDEAHGQVRFVELHPRPEILPGKVIRIPVGKDLLPEGKKLKDYQKARIEAEYLAAWIKRAGPAKLSASSWCEVAILCPRKAWLQTMAAALRRLRLPVAIQSERDAKGDSPAYAWLTALCTIMADPLNAYEIVGVLREVFGLSDHDLAVFSEGEKTRFRIDQEQAASGHISSRLRALAQTRQRIEGFALFDAVARIVEETQLRERLLLLPADEFGDLGRELDTLLALAAEAEASGIILAEFVERLRADFTTARNPRPSADDDAIQLITAHKAKGSEWHAVIVPFLARDFRTPSSPYPHLVRPPGTDERLIALGKEDKSKELKDAIERAQIQELERLLYVATTRARHTLVLALDQEIFATAPGHIPKGAQLRRLVRGKDIYAGEFDPHTSTIEECGDDSPAIASAPPSQTITTLPRLDSRKIKLATRRASDFIRKSKPSAFDAEFFELPAALDSVAVPVSHIRSGADNLATLYGRWWHSFFEAVDWRDDLAAAQQLFETQLPASPKPEQSAKDWAATRKTLFSDPAIAVFTARTETKAHSEFPFSWKLSDCAVLEGVIDLLLIDPAARRALLIDWKTNRVTTKDRGKLSVRYRPQLAAYWKAVSEITGFAVEAGLYSTALGQLLLFPSDELETEWTRLAKLPPDRLEGEISE